MSGPRLRARCGGVDHRWVLGDPPERVDVGPHSVVAVEPMTPLQVRNEGDEELVLFIYGAPPEQAGADFLDDPGDL